LAYVTAGRVLKRTAELAEAARQAERGEARRAALLALNWELEVNQELLERAEPMGIPTLLPHVAFDAALAWYRSLPDTARGTLHEAQLAVARYNADAEHLRSVLVGPAPGLGGPGSAAQTARGDNARNAVLSSTATAITAFARARNELTKELSL
jgi:hypothetical protein